MRKFADNERKKLRAYANPKLEKGKTLIFSKEGRGSPICVEVHPESSDKPLTNLFLNHGLLRSARLVRKRDGKLPYSQLYELLEYYPGKNILVHVSKLEFEFGVPN